MADVRPIVGISMGDPFGNGPEISVKSLADKTLYDRCKPLIVGDKSSMEYALAVARKVSGIDLKLNIVKEPAEGKYEYGTIDLIDLGIVPAEKIPNTLDDPKGPQPFHIGACELGGWYDIVVVMYHDQGHIPLKVVGFVYNKEEHHWEAVAGINMTLGLPIIRVSVDHGTGFADDG